MAERPILFSAPMVRAILEGRKTQTRRILKPQPFYTRGELGCIDRAGAPQKWLPDLPGLTPYAVGDRLWVREAWRTIGNAPLSECINHTDIHFRASASEAARETFTWRSPIHMPRWASRITLRVTDVRVQRLQEISEEDAKAEGVSLMDWERKDVPEEGADNHVECFSWLWESIHGPSSWDANPWVAAITFERV